MQKTIGLALNKFNPVPSTLRATPALNIPRAEIAVNLASLYHHYYIGSYGRFPPHPDPAHFEYLDLLLPEKEFRVRGDGLGISTEVRRNRSNDLGRAFCRWFLHDHADITYFAHLGDLIGRQLHRAFGQLKLERVAPGDAPDFFCAKDSNRIFLAEAKGSHSRIAFTNKKFVTWRDQFTRVAIKDSSNAARKVKGFIVATQFANEMNPKMESKIYAEDPDSPGDVPLGDDFGGDIARAVQSMHYSRIAEKLNQPVLAASLASGLALSADYLVRAFVWAFQDGPLKGKRFVGGYYPSADGIHPIADANGKVWFRAADPLRLDVGRGTFVGVEENIFKQVTDMARRGAAQASQIQSFEDIQFFYSAISILRDGSVIAPVEFFVPVAELTF